jgi:hypothetical protein
VVDVPGHSVVTIPPDQTLLYRSPDLTIKLESTGPQGAAYIGTPSDPGPLQLRFDGYNVIDSLSVSGLATSVNGSLLHTPQGNTTEFQIGLSGAGHASFNLSSTTGAVPPSVLEVDVGNGSVPQLTLTAQGSPHAFVGLEFSDPYVDSAVVSYNPYSPLK